MQSFSQNNCAIIGALQSPFRHSKVFAEVLKAV